MKWNKKGNRFSQNEDRIGEGNSEIVRLDEPQNQEVYIPANARRMESQESTDRKESALVRIYTVVVQYIKLRPRGYTDLCHRIMDVAYALVTDSRVRWGRTAPTDSYRGLLGWLHHTPENGGAWAN